MRTLKRACAILTLAAAVAGAGSSATPRKIAVLPVQVDPSAKGSVPAFADEVVLTAVHGLGGYSVIGKDDVDALLDFEQQRDLLGCAEASCMAQIGGALGVDELLVLRIARVSTEWAVSVKRIDMRASEVIARSTEMFEGSAKHLLATLPALVRKSFAGVETPPAVTRESGLVARWSFNDVQDWAIPDGSGNHNQGRLGEGAKVVAGHAGRAISFDGVNDYVEVPDTPALHSDDGFSAMGWLVVRRLDKEWQAILWKGDPDDCAPGCTNRELTLWVNRLGYLHAASTPVSRLNGEQMTCESGHGMVEPGRWTHFAVAVNRATRDFTIWLDGRLVASCPYDDSPMRDTAGPLRLGSTIGWDAHLDGMLDEISLYGHGLRKEEVERGYGEHTKPEPETPPATVLPRNDLIAAWTFDGGDSRDTGGRHNLQHIGGAHIEAGRGGRALVLDGAGAYAETADAPTLHGAGAVTVSAWVNPAGFAKEWQTILWKGDLPDCTPGCTNREIGLWINKEGYLHLTSAATGEAEQRFCNSGDGLLAPGRWTHVAATVSSRERTMSIWIDGRRVARCAHSGAPIHDSSGPLRLGTNPSWDSAFAGGIDQVRLYARDLSEAEIAALAADGR